MQKILGYLRRAVQEFDLIQDGDRIAVGVSGGKDSLVLLQGLALLRKFIGIEYELVGITLDPVFGGEITDYSPVQEMCEQLQVEYHVIRTQIGEIVFDIRHETRPCSLCARMRRGALHDAAKKYGCNKIALGHHYDDAVETFVMNLFTEGRIGCFSPKTYLSIKDLWMIRPLALAPEREISHAAKKNNLVIVKSKCPVDGLTSRQKTKEFLREREKNDPGFTYRLFGAMRRSGIDGWGFKSQKSDVKSQSSGCGRKFVLIPDSFKGTMSSEEICEIMKRALLAHFPQANIISVPVADGGEGSVDAFLSAMGGEKIKATVSNPYFEPMEGFYGVISNDTAVIEMASCAGLPLVENRLNPMKTTTYGVGELIRHAINSGCKKIILGLGGSATNDGGAGCAAALGVRFLNKSDEEFIPTGGTLCNIAKIDMSGLMPEIKDIPIISMCDIDNPLCGDSGAAAIFAPQKGADANMVTLLDAGLNNLAACIEHDLNVNVLNIPGAGAAGGMGAGTVAFLGAKLQMGIETVLDAVDFNTLIKGCDFVFTGEGKIDTQSLRGKVIVGVAGRCKSKHVPLIAVVGDIGDNINSIYDLGVTSIFSINRVAIDFPHAKLRAKTDLELTLHNIARLI